MVWWCGIQLIENPVGYNDPCHLNSVFHSIKVAAKTNVFATTRSQAHVSISRRSGFELYSKPSLRTGSIDHKKERRNHERRRQTGSSPVECARAGRAVGQRARSLPPARGLADPVLRVQAAFSDARAGRAQRPAAHSQVASADDPARSGGAHSDVELGASDTGLQLAA